MAKSERMTKISQNDRKLKKRSWSKIVKILSKPENISMLSEENIISLIMKRDDLASFEFWNLRKERREHASDSSSQTRLEIVQNQFRQMRRRRVAAFRLFAQPNGAHFEMRWKQGCKFFSLRFLRNLRFSTFRILRFANRKL